MSSLPPTRICPQPLSKDGFREDLWYRLQVVPLWLPPLRERLGDVVLLAEHFLRLQGGDSPKRLSAAAARLLLAHSWPGNVRELRNAMERAVLLSHGPVIEIEHVGLQIPTAPSTPGLEIDWNGSLDQAVARVEREMIARSSLRPQVTVQKPPDAWDCRANSYIASWPSSTWTRSLQSGKCPIL